MSKIQLPLYLIEKHDHFLATKTSHKDFAFFENKNYTTKTSFLSVSYDILKLTKLSDFKVEVDSYIWSVLT